MNLKRIAFGNMKMRQSINCFVHIFLFISVLSFSAGAQSFKASARIDTNSIKIGEQFHLILEAQAPAGYKFIFPQLPDTITKLEITDRSKIDTSELKEKKLYSYRQAFLITCFDSGYFPISPFVFTYQQPGDTAQHTFETEAMLVTVQGTPLETSKKIDPLEFVRVIATARIMMPRSYVRLSAGRSEMSDEMQALCFFAGANSIFYGNALLTADNPEQDKDRELFNRLGISPQKLNPPPSESVRDEVCKIGTSTG